MIVAEYIVGLLLEDRIDDLLKRYANYELNRPWLERMTEFDPTANKKYFPWIIKQFVQKKLKLPSGGERIRDDLMRFERLLAIPAFTESRDINQYDAKTLAQMIRRTADIQSKTEQERETRTRNVKIVGRSGNIEVAEIKNAQELMNRAWSAYSKDNPNWKGTPLTPPRPGEEREFRDGLWCVRFPQYARSYLADGPFYMVYKNGGPYAGIVFERGECQTLDNRGINMGMAEEIYPALKSLIDIYAHEKELSGNCAIFANMRFLTGDAKPGETVSGPRGVIDLSFSTLQALPERLTVDGSLDLTGCPIRELPDNLTVSGGVLKIAGTPITVLPPTLRVSEMEWSEPLPPSEIKNMFYRMRLEKLKAHFWNNDKLYKPMLGKNGQPIMITVRNAKGKTERVAKPQLDAAGNKIPLTDQEKEEAWLEFQPKLSQFFADSAKMEASARAIFHYVPLSTVQSRQGGANE